MFAGNPDATLLDKQQIHEVLVRYCRGVDRCDAELINSAYHPDAIDNHSVFTFRGCDAGPTLVEHIQRTSNVSLHFVSNETILIDGDVAHCECYYHAHYVKYLEDAVELRDGYGRYIDRMERRDGEWRIAHRVVIVEARNTIRMQGTERAEAGVKALRSKDDLSYRRLEPSPASRVP